MHQFLNNQLIFDSYQSINYWNTYQNLQYSYYNNHYAYQQMAYPQANLYYQQKVPYNLEQAHHYEDPITSTQCTRRSIIEYQDVIPQITNETIEQYILMIVNEDETYHNIVIAKQKYFLSLIKFIISIFTLTFSINSILYDYANQFQIILSIFQVLVQQIQAMILIMKPQVEQSYNKFKEQIYWFSLYGVETLQKDGSLSRLQDQKFHYQISSPETDYKSTQKEQVPLKSQEEYQKETQQLLYFTPKKTRHQNNEIYYTPEIKRKPINQVEQGHNKFKQIGNILFAIQVLIIILLEVMK